ncbi:MAG TPA: hypothetical protein DCF63_08185 [Planctomycetaceae bacterium]|nr:hypothetical protein [Planctomycetaceae bacterium]
MIRILVIAVIALGLGATIGTLQAKWKRRGVVEQFQVASTAAGSGQAQPVQDRVVGIPKLELPDGDTFRFGQMLHGSSMSHDFLVRNSGDGPLTLEQIGSTCKCTVGKLSNNVLKPGEETKVTLTWRAQVVAPVFGQSATFKTNDTQQPELRLQIEGSVIDSFVFEPSSVDLGDFMTSQGATRQFMVYSYSDPDVELSQTQWTDSNSVSHIQLSHQPMEIDPTSPHAKAHRAYRLNLSVGPGMPLGPLSTKIRFVTNHGEQIEVPELEVNGRVVSEISIVGGTAFNAQRNMLDMGTVSAKQGASIHLYLVVRGDDREGFEVTAEQAEANESLKVQVAEPKIFDDRTMIPIHFEVPKGAPEVYYPGTGAGTFVPVLIRTSSSKLPELPIRVRVVVRP